MRRLARILVAGLAVVVAAAFPAAANAADPPVGPWIKFRNFQFNTCLDLANGSSSVGNNLVVSTCNPNRASQTWAIASNNGQYLIKSFGTGLCVSVAAKSLADQASLVLWDCKADSGNQDQRWSFAPSIAGCNGIRNFNSGLVMGVKNAQPSVLVVQESGPVFGDRVWCDVLAGGAV